MELDVGQRLKAVRTAQGLSQRQLAAKAGVTSGTISMIEQNRISPSISSLKKILQAVPMTLSEFFSAELDGTDKVFYSFGELREINPVALNGRAGKGRTAAISFRQVGDASRHSLQILYESYAPGADTGEELYAHEAEEGGIVVSGEIEVTVGNQVRVLRPGDAYLFDSRIPHRFRNPGHEPCILISVCTPPSF
ncbi:MAG: cupin domain-containing protein [Rhodomicrobium sp.]|nr:cupin domain-containing protein [Rhodomicrobium sp.]